ncbi:MAG TPA: hypothetical protein EYF98_16165 [Planctomycetes bacterium]|nr:hypothetical protein [Planctomycetota bacterium]
MQPGSARAVAICNALNGGPAGLEQGHWSRLLEISYAAFLEELGLYAGAPARKVAEAQYRAAPGTWSVLCLEGVARRTGDLGRSAEVLESALAAESEPATQVELRERRSIVAGGAGDLETQFDWLGRALASRGSDGLQMRARLALAHGARERARALFRVLVDRGRGPSPDLGEPPPWALRGWGLALLPSGTESFVLSGGLNSQIQPFIRNPSLYRD